jgi:hypothetical protein
VALVKAEGGYSDHPNWNGFSGAISAALTAGVYGSGYTSVDTQNSTAVAVSTTSLWMGFYHRIPTSGNGYDGSNLPGSLGSVCNGWASTYHWTLNPLSDGSIRLRSGSGSGTILATTAAGLYDFNRWQWVEIDTSVATAGWVRVKIDGIQVLSYDGDVHNTGTPGTFGFMSHGAASNTHFASLVIYDAVPARLGPFRSETLIPNGNGYLSQWTGSDGNSTDNYLLLDEAPADSADYSAGLASGNIDAYALPSLVHSGAPELVSVLEAAATLSGHDKQLVRVGGANYYGSNKTIGGSWAGYSDVWETSPATSSAWSFSEIDGMEIGVEVL